jgi:hypothetical protein
MPQTYDVYRRRLEGCALDRLPLHQRKGYRGMQRLSAPLGRFTLISDGTKRVLRVKDFNSADDAC